MKTISVKSFFKKVSEKATVRAGMKREDLNWNFEGFEAADVATLDADKVSFVLNKFIEDFGRKLIAQNGDDWDFAPTAETVNFEAAYLDATTQTSRSRLITKESLQKLGAFYLSQAAKLGIVSASAAAGAKVIESRFQLVAGKDDAIKVMQSRLLQLVEVCEPDDVEPFAPLIEALIAETESLMAVTITADAL